MLADQHQRQPREHHADHQHDGHRDGHRHGAHEDIPGGDALILQVRLHHEHRQTERRREQADLDGDDADQPEPHQVDAERLEHRDHERQHDQHDRDRSRGSSRAPAARPVADQHRQEAQIGVLQPLADRVGQAGHGQHLRIERRRHQQEADRRGDAAGLQRHLPELLQRQLAARQRDQERRQRAGAAGLGRREEAAIDAAQHGADQDDDRQNFQDELPGRGASSNGPWYSPLRARSDRPPPKPARR